MYLKALFMPKMIVYGKEYMKYVKYMINYIYNAINIYMTFVAFQSALNAPILYTSNSFSYI